MLILTYLILWANHKKFSMANSLYWALMSVLTHGRWSQMWMLFLTLKNTQNVSSLFNRCFIG